MKFKCEVCETIFKLDREDNEPLCNNPWCPFCGSTDAFPYYTKGELENGKHLKPINLKVNIRKIEVDWNTNEVKSFGDIIETAYSSKDRMYIHMIDGNSDLDFHEKETLTIAPEEYREYKIFARETTEYFIVEE